MLLFGYDRIVVTLRKIIICIWLKNYNVEYLIPKDSSNNFDLAGLVKSLEPEKCMLRFSWQMK